MRKAMRTAAGLLAALVLTLVAREAGAEQPPPLDAPAGIYVVRPGDNLWSLSGQFLHNPFLWPRIWERNKFVINANRIYPGDPLLIPGYVPPPPEGAAPPKGPVAVPAVPAPAPVGVPEPEPVAAAPAAPEAVVGAPVEPEPAPTIIAPPPAVLRVVTPTQYVCLGFIHEGGPLGVGNILRPLRDSVIIMPYDTVFLTLRPGTSVQVGQVFQVIRQQDAPVLHPRTGRTLGRLIRGRGLLQVTEVQDRSVRAKVIYGCEDMAAGDTLVPYEETEIPALGAALPTALSADGMIVHADLSRVSSGHLHVVYLDLGRQAGIVPGDVFAVHRETGFAADRRGGGTIRLTPTLIGDLVVIRVTDRTATARVLRSDRDLHVGDRIRLAAKMP